MLHVGSFADCRSHLRGAAGFRLFSACPACAAAAWFSIAALWLAVWADRCPANAVEMPARAHVRVITDGSIAREKQNSLVKLASKLRVRLDYFVISEREDLGLSITGPDLIIVDIPAPEDQRSFNERLVPVLASAQTPWIRVGSDRPLFGNIAPLHARRLLAHYAAGGAGNLKQMFGYIGAWRSGEALTGFLSPAVLPALGIYHPSAPGPFASVQAFFDWGQGRWRERATRIAFVVPVAMITNLQTEVIDELIEQSERRGIVPVAFWFQATDPSGLQRFLYQANPDALVITKCVERQSSQSATSLASGIPILASFGATRVRHHGDCRK